MMIDPIMKKVFRGRPGEQYDDENSLTDLDDSTIEKNFFSVPPKLQMCCTIFANTDAEVTDILHYITRNAQLYGLRINADKTKVLSTGGSLASIHLDSVQIEQVQEFKYLGSLVQEKKVVSTTEIYNRIWQAMAIFASLKWCI
uniref:Reverse transcriptase n=1 Tax=Romanomermis culicivorax TaxID=13658 RepID=A0A915L601_ROMCU